jgi:putative transcriptional regulator
MKKSDKTKKRLLHEAHEMAKDLHEIGALDFTTMREFDALCLSQIHELSAAKIKSIRRKARISQSVFARIINVSLAAIKQWERGERKPSGAALKLLNLVQAHGIEFII